MANFPDCGFPECGFPGCGFPVCEGFDGGEVGPSIPIQAGMIGAYDFTTLSNITLVPGGPDNGLQTVQTITPYEGGYGIPIIVTPPPVAAQLPSASLTEGEPEGS